MDILKSRKLWYSVTGGLFLLAGLWICGALKVPDLTGAAALAGIAAAFGLSVHHQGKADLLPKE